MENTKEKSPTQTIREALAAMKSCIQCGESWTKEMEEQAYRPAMEAIEALGKRHKPRPHWRRYTPVETEALARFEDVCKKELARAKGDTEQRRKDAAVNAIAIAARHFATGRNEDLGYRRRLLEIAAEITGVPLVRLPQPDGTDAMAWPPVRGEVGWLPYEENPMAWGDNSGSRWQYMGATDAGQ